MRSVMQYGFRYGFRATSGMPDDSEAGTAHRHPRAMTDESNAAAWAEVHRNTPEGWQVGRPGYEERYHQWSMYAFDPAERPVVGKRSREWTAVGQTELHCLQVMARCLAQIKAGRWPR
jgi:hypothetical protein